MTNFKAGDKVVCVDDSPSSTYGEKLLLKYAIYVIRDAKHFPPWGIAVDVGVPSKIDYFPWWREERFRKLITRTERERMEVERKMPLTIKESVERGLLMPINPMEIKLT